MRKRLLFCALTCLLLLPAATCDTSSIVKDPSKQPTELDVLKDCTMRCMEDAFELFEGFLSFLEVVNDAGLPNPPGLSYNRTTGVFSFSLDLDDTLGDETAVAGEIYAGLNSNLIDGMQAGEVAAASWAMTRNLGADTLGTGGFSFYEFDMTVDRFRMTIFEETGLMVNDPCDFELTSLGLHVALEDLAPDTIYTAIFTGVLEFTTRTTVDKYLTGMVTFDGTKTGSLSILHDGTQYQGTIDLETFRMTTTPVTAPRVLASGREPSHRKAGRLGDT